MQARHVHISGVHGWATGMLCKGYPSLNLSYDMHSQPQLAILDFVAASDYSQACRYNPPLVTFAPTHSTHHLQFDGCGPTALPCHEMMETMARTAALLLILRIAAARGSCLPLASHAVFVQPVTGLLCMSRGDFEPEPGLPSTQACTSFCLHQPHPVLPRYS